VKSALVANPAAGGGKVGRRLAEVVRRLEAKCGAIELRETTGPGEATALATGLAESGFERVFSLGGDGTHGEVAEGLVGRGLVLAPLPGGTGSDWCRLLAWGGDLDRALELAPDAVARPCDAGRVHFQRDDGQPGAKVFLNVASLGIGGEVDRRLQRTRLGGRFDYLRATISSLIRYEAPKIRVFVDGKDEGEWTVFAVFVANGQFVGGGMWVAPHARPDDGRLEVVAMLPRPVLVSLRKARDIYSGRHLDDPATRVWAGREVRVELVGGVGLLDIDGESPGRIPAKFEILPAALRVAGLK
jgi:YegS/Rv2252/BmrU family lipid kinase